MTRPAEFEAARDLIRVIVDECGGDFEEAAAEFREHIRLVSGEEEFRAAAEDELAKAGIKTEAKFQEFYRRVRDSNIRLAALLDDVSDGQLAIWFRELLHPI